MEFFIYFTANKENVHTFYYSFLKIVQPFFRAAKSGFSQIKSVFPQIDENDLSIIS